jgi:hypothetical protein
MTTMVSRLYRIIEKDPKLADLSIYTISTIPERFPAMPSWLKKHGKENKEGKKERNDIHL